MANMEIRFKRGTANRWNELNPILKNAEPGFEYDTGKFKIGDGIHTWKELPYQNEGSVKFVENFEDLPEVGISNFLYSVSSDRLIYQWNSKTNEYEPFGGNGSFDPNIITNINGGNANG